VIKLLLIPIGALVIYCTVLLGLLYSQGLLTEEGLRQVLQGGPPPATPAIHEPVEALDTLARQQRAREEALNRREETLQQQEQRVTMARQDLMGLYDQLNGLLTEFNASLDALDADREERLNEVANSLARMDARKAAQTVAGLDEEVQVQVLGRIADRSRGDILSNLEPDVAARILSRFQEPRY
jgi:flagellar motility protein MotE (MotC chaperone)